MKSNKLEPAGGGRSGPLAGFARWIWRSVKAPDRVTETQVQVRELDTTLRQIRRQLLNNPSNSGVLHDPLEVYRGYADTDAEVFDRFTIDQTPAGEKGFITDFLGVRTRSNVIKGIDRLDGKVTGAPVHGDGWHAEAVEWVGLLKCVTSTKGRLIAMELGAGWGPWVVAAAAAAHRLEINEVRLCAVEADPAHYEMLVEHFRDNGLDPDKHKLIKAAVGTKAGTARWPKVPDASDDWGSRPQLAEDAGGADHVGREFDEWMDVEIVPISELLTAEPVWDLVHIDVQGWEVDLCTSAVDLLDERVKWLIIGTHDAKLHGDLVSLMFERGWVLENEKPPRFTWKHGASSLIAMTTHDGTLVWRNPKLTAQP